MTVTNQVVMELYVAQASGLSGTETDLVAFEGKIDAAITAYHS